MSGQRKKQKTYSLSQDLVDLIHTTLNDNKEALNRLGVTNETRLLDLSVRNGLPAVKELLDELQAKRKTHQTPPQ